MRASKSAFFYQKGGAPIFTTPGEKKRNMSWKGGTIARKPGKSTEVRKSRNLSGERRLCRSSRKKKEKRGEREEGR